MCRNPQDIHFTVLKSSISLVDIMIEFMRKTFDSNEWKQFDNEGNWFKKKHWKCNSTG